MIIELTLTIKVLKPKETYRGRNYSDWIEEWSNWLVSSSVDYNSGVEMLFLRGNLDYESDQTANVNRFVKPDKFLDKTGSLGETIYENTAVFIPVMTAMYSLNDSHESVQLLDEGGLRYAVRRDISEGGKMWLRYKDSSGVYQTVVPDIKEYYFETSVFTLRISSENPLLTKFESPTDPGEYQTVQGGYFVILTDLSVGTYRFHFGGNGRGYYYTDAVYDIKVEPSKPRDLTEDVSAENLNMKNNTLMITQKKKFLHLKTEDVIDNTSPFP